MRFLDVQILREKIFELSQSFSSNYRFRVVEIDYFLNIGKSASVVDDIIRITVVLLEGNVIDHKLTVA
jgi:hypothetical protein